MLPAPATLAVLPSQSAALNHPWRRHRRLGVVGRAPLLALVSLAAVAVLPAWASSSQKKAQRRVMPAHPVVLAISKALETHDAKMFENLFAKDADIRIGSQKFPAGASGLWKALEQPPLSETTPFQVQEDSERSLSPSFVLVYAHLVQYGAVIVKRELPLQLILRKQGSAWRIVSFWLPRPDVAFPPPH